MTPNELAAFHAGVRHAADMALITATTMEARSSIPQIRARAAIAALQALAEALKRSVKPAATDDMPTASYAPAHAPEGREASVAQGFTGDACSTCGAFRMLRIGTCLTCQACGSTTGCS